MKKRLILFILLISTSAFGQRNEQTITTTKTKPTIPEQTSTAREPYFDYYQDFQNYASHKASKYKTLYDKYAQVDSLPDYKPVTKNEKEYPSPCYVITDDGRVKTGMSYRYTFLQQMFYKSLICLKDGSDLDPVFMRYQAYNYLTTQTTKEAIKLLIQHEEAPLKEYALDELFEKAKMLFREASYEKSNAIFSFLSTVDERYREAAINNVGLSFYHQKEYRRAFDYFQRAIDLYPQGYLAYLNAGACKVYLPVDMGDQNLSIYYFKKAYELAPENPNVIANYKNAMKLFLGQQGIETSESK